MCKPLKEYLAVVREYKDTIVMFIGIAACVFVYAISAPLPLHRRRRPPKQRKSCVPWTGGFPPWNIREEAVAVNKLLNPSVLLPLMGGSGPAFLPPAETRLQALPRSVSPLRALCSSDVRNADQL